MKELSLFYLRVSTVNDIFKTEKKVIDYQKLKIDKDDVTGFGILSC